MLLDCPPKSDPPLVLVAGLLPNNDPLVLVVLEVTACPPKSDPLDVEASVCPPNNDPLVDGPDCPPNSDPPTTVVVVARPPNSDPVVLVAASD